MTAVETLLLTVVKEILRYRREWNFSVQTFYVPSKDNPADKDT